MDTNYEKACVLIHDPRVPVVLVVALPGPFLLGGPPPPTSSVSGLGWGYSVAALGGPFPLGLPLQPLPGAH